MASPQIPTKAELLEALRSSGREVVEAVRALPLDSLEEGRYQSGWNGRQILAHVASIEWTYPKLFDVAGQAAAGAIGSGEVRRTEPGDAAGTPTRIAQGGIDGYNERQVAKRAEASAAELLEEFERNRAATIRAVESADEALLTRPIRSAGGITGALSAVLRAVAVDHVRAHARDIAGR